MIAVRIEYAHAAPVDDVLPDHVLQQLRFSSAGRANDVGMFETSPERQKERCSPLVPAEDDRGAVDRWRKQEPIAGFDRGSYRLVAYDGTLDDFTHVLSLCAHGFPFARVAASLARASPRPWRCLGRRRSSGPAVLPRNQKSRAASVARREWLPALRQKAPPRRAFDAISDRGTEARIFAALPATGGRRQALLRGRVPRLCAG